MANTQPAVVVNGTTQTDETAAFQLPGSGIQVTAAFGAVSGTDPSLTVYADVLNGVNWQQVLELSALTEAGYQQGVAQSPYPMPPGRQQWRLRWTVSGTNPVFLGALVAAGV